MIGVEGFGAGKVAGSTSLSCHLQGAVRMMEEVG